MKREIQAALGRIAKSNGEAKRLPREREELFRLKMGYGTSPRNSRN